MQKRRINFWDTKTFWLIAPAILALAAVAGYFSPRTIPFIGVLAMFSLVFLYSHGRRISGINAEVERAERDLQNTLYALQDALIIYDTDFTVRHFNRAAENLFKVRADAVIGNKLQPKDAQNPGLMRLVQTIFPSLAPMMAAQPKPASGVSEVVLITFADPELNLMVTTTPLTDERGRSSGFVKIIHDRTAELSVIKSKNEFITIASHQLRTPLTEISWALESLAQDSSLSASAHDIAATTFVATKAVVKVTEDLLNIAKIEEGRYGYEFEEVDIEKFLEELMEQVMPAVKQTELKLYFDRSREPLPPVVADPKKLSIAFMNLLENAIKYNVKGGEVTVKTEKVANSPFVQVSVKDTGIGIPPGDQNKLFTKFFRAENALKFQTRGSGLGLYIVRNIIRAHGGQIQIESQPGRGTTIMATLSTDPNYVPSKEVPLQT